MTELLWLNGKIVTLEQASISPDDRGILLGDGLFETLRVTNGRAPHLTRHLRRLREGCETLMIAWPGLDTLQGAVRDLIRHCAVQDATLRVTVTRGAGGRGILPGKSLSPTIMIRLSPSVPCRRSGLRLGLSRYRRDGDSPLSKVKSLGMLVSVMARLEADQAGWDDALLLGVNGNIAESSVSNVVFLKNDNLFTPPLSDGGLAGTSRARLLESGLCEEASIGPDELIDVEAVWLINALGTASVAEIAGQRFDHDDLTEDQIIKFLYW